ncbi:hypothetical protein [Bacillus horti]|uniref:Uncharacterized protein n=1 Tax=Caldalkalibacillus horti TaxID=77523 RepID=A0ABT9W4W3_9BACI|nr:hypothetical protein [Bacillus horti]MDQ0168170.1 hypothetical protein [Bacillus horti]
MQRLGQLAADRGMNNQWNAFYTYMDLLSAHRSEMNIGTSLFGYTLQTANKN